MSRFASNFASNFAGAGGYICPMTAQARLVAGVAAVVSGSSVLVGGKRLMGIAGGVYRFGSPESAAAWIDRTRAAGIAESGVLGSVPEALTAAWVEKKLARYAARAEQCVAAASRQSDYRKRVALIEEAATAQGKWA